MTPALDLDTQLMIRVQSDDATSFGELLHRNRNIVLNYLSRMVVNRAIAEELAQRCIHSGLSFLCGPTNPPQSFPPGSTASPLTSP